MLCVAFSAKALPCLVLQTRHLPLAPTLNGDLRNQKPCPALSIVRSVIRMTRRKQ
ncbi:MAG: hypothetical protein HW380_3786 [Magnetococcales bacterium]|nr:hypothetical protein [Magnetococcales bacterium]